MTKVLLTLLGAPIAGLLIALVVAIVLRMKHGVPLDPLARALALLGSLPLLAAFVAPPILVICFGGISPHWFPGEYGYRHFIYAGPLVFGALGTLLWTAILAPRSRAKSRTSASIAVRA